MLICYCTSSDEAKQGVGSVGLTIWAIVTEVEYKDGKVTCDFTLDTSHATVGTTATLELGEKYTDPNGSGSGKETWDFQHYSREDDDGDYTTTRTHELSFTSKYTDGVYCKGNTNEKVVWMN